MLSEGLQLKVFTLLRDDGEVGTCCSKKLCPDFFWVRISPGTVLFSPVTRIDAAVSRTRRKHAARSGEQALPFASVPRYTTIAPNASMTR